MLADIRETLLSEARKAGESAMKTAEAELESELAKAKKEGEALVHLAKTGAKSAVENERRERQSWAKIEAKRVIIEAKEDAVNAAFDDLIELLKKYAGTKPYAEKMREKISAATGEIGGKCIIRIRKGDKKLLQIKGADIIEGADIMGGAIVESRDGKFRIDLSLESELAQKRDEIRKDLYKRLFK